MIKKMNGDFEQLKERRDYKHASLGARGRQGM
jgi:hypothetical protein